MWRLATAGFFFASALLGEPARLAVASHRSPPPRIDHIEISGEYVTIHFETLPNRAYEVQAGDGIPANEWKTIYFARAIPALNHHVAVDFYTNKHRFYRLSATP